MSTLRPQKGARVLCVLVIGPQTADLAPAAHRQTRRDEAACPIVSSAPRATRKVWRIRRPGSHWRPSDSSRSIALWDSFLGGSEVGATFRFSRARTRIDPHALSATPRLAYPPAHDAGTRLGAGESPARFPLHLPLKIRFPARNRPRAPATRSRFAKRRARDASIRVSPGASPSKSTAIPPDLRPARSRRSNDSESGDSRRIGSSRTSSPAS